MTLNFTTLIFVFMIFGCSSSNQLAEKKFDAPLKQKLAEIKSSEAPEILKIFIQCEREIDSDMKKLFEKSGLNIESVIGDICTASGTVKEIQEIAKHQHVKQIQLATTSKPLY